MPNKRATNKTGQAVVICLAPDVCKTPMGPSVVPVPYPIIAKFDTSQLTSVDVCFEGNPAFHMGSFIPQVVGDEAGVAGGVKSNVFKGACKPIEHSTTLRTNGQWVIRHGDMMEMNCAGPRGPGNTQGKVLFIAIITPVVVNPDTGEAEYVGHEEYTDAEGNKHVTEYKIKQGAEGNIEQVGVAQGTQAADGSASIQASSTKFNADGSVAEYRAESHEMAVPPANPSTQGPVPGNDAIGTSSPDGRTDLGDGTYGRTASSPPESSPMRSDPPVDPASDPEYSQARADAAAAQAEIDAANKEMVWEGTKTGLDVAGLVDPTPASDVLSGGMSLAEGDFVGAGLSFLSIVPYLGDAVAKPFKAAKATAKATKLAQKLAAAEAKLKKAKEAAEAALKKLKKLKKSKSATAASKEVDAAKHADGGLIRGVPKGTSGLKNVRKGDAAAENARHTKPRPDGKSGRPPYDESKPVFHGEADGSTEYARVHDGSNAEGPWMMPKNEIEGLSPAQIKDKFALPTEPTMIQSVTPPAGTKLTIGTAGKLPGWGSGGGLQVESMGRLPSSAFGSSLPL